ncbi:protein NRT1/ PTR FAMILY 2.8 [Juglans microcarpa x Juglans regia]|uniref:protein NRT1/ PTR FAMILY 2.8 n=1 Tax=Juglans microcarpa x Juglans regia TaxID=2249226 RepID=UPI001B7E8AE4|nr:protein NRT1/ PTR FAMILY 2.8 [Juglans microcarpa x Juglans regia]
MEVSSSVLEQDGTTTPPPTDPPHHSTKKLGGWKSIAYIIGNESFEKLASMSLISNMAVYLVTEYNLRGIFVVNVVNIWYGTSNIASIAGAFISDAYLGRFRTILLGSVASLLGMGTMTLTAALHRLRPSTCNGQSQCPKPLSWQLAFLFMALAMLSLGAGGIRPCNIAFGADQFDTQTKKGRAQLESFFNWWYFSFTVALIVALTAVVYIQTNVSWALGFAIPTVCLCVSIAIFLTGRHTYIYKKPQGNIFADLAKVIIAACRKRRLTAGPAFEYSFYDPPMKGSELLTIRLVHTDRFLFLDKAAIIAEPSELDNQGRPRNGWKLCSLQQVEQLKCLVATLPIWVSGIGCFMTMDQQNTFGVLQLMQMDRSIGTHFKVPPGWMNIAPMIALSIWIFIYERVYIVQAKKLTERDRRLTMQQRISTGIVMSILCMLVAGVIEKKRREAALRHGSFISPLSFALLLPQFVLSGLTEAFGAVAIMELFTLQMPESMRTMASGIFFLNLSISNYFGSLLVNIIHHLTSKRGKSPWLGGHDLNMNRLDYYYYIVATLAALNFVYFTFFASRYVSSSRVCSGKGEISLESSIASHP